MGHIYDFTDIGSNFSKHAEQTITKAFNNPVFSFNNYPNPFNSVTTLKFTLPQPMNAKIEVYNSLGQRIRLLLDNYLPAGEHEIDFNGEELSSSLYLCRIEAGNFRDVRKIVLVK